MQHAIKFTLCKIPIDSNIDNDSNVAENFDNFNHNIWLLFWVFFFWGGGAEWALFTLAQFWAFAGILISQGPKSLVVWQLDNLCKMLFLC